jgi:hypothetical protein
MKPKYMPEYHLAVVDPLFAVGDILGFFGQVVEVLDVRYETHGNGEQYNESGVVAEGYVYLLKFEDGSEDTYFEEDLVGATKIAQTRSALVFYLKDFSSWYSWNDGTWDSFIPGTHTVIDSHIPHPPVEAYELVAEVPVDGATSLHDCEQMFELFNIGNRPVPVRSMSIGDIVVTNGVAYICAEMGFKPAEWFLGEYKTAQSVAETPGGPMEDRPVNRDDDLGIDYVECGYCGFIGAVRMDESRCPECGTDGRLMWANSGDAVKVVASSVERFNTPATDWLGDVAAQVEVEATKSNHNAQVEAFLDTLSLDQLSSRDATLHAAAGVVSRTRTGRYTDTDGFLKAVEYSRRLRYSRYSGVSHTKRDIEGTVEIPLETLYT